MPGRTGAGQTGWRTQPRAIGNIEPCRSTAAEVNELRRAAAHADQRVSVLEVLAGQAILNRDVGDAPRLGLVWVETAVWLVAALEEGWQRLVKAIDTYAAIYRKGCTPPNSVTWDSSGNNEAFLAGTVVMTPNYSLSIPNALKGERPDDYYENVATVEWPLSPAGEPFQIPGFVFSAVAFKDGGNVATAKEFVRFLLAEGWLMHYLNFSGERMLPSIPALLDQPFWLDPSDRHHIAAVMQAQSRPPSHDYTAALGRSGA